MTKNIYLLIVMLPILLQFSCVLPPGKEQPAVLPIREFEFLSAVERGKAYQARRKYMLAEAEFYKAKELMPSVATVYNNLGFILGEQGRFQEATIYLEEAIAKDPENLTTRDNLARIYYRLGDFEKTLANYKAMLRIHHALLAEGESDQGLSSQEEVNVLRNIALTYFAMGIIDEGLCHLQLAANTSQHVYLLGEYFRALISNGFYYDAYLQQQQLVRALDLRVPPELLFDYALTAYLLNEIALSMNVLETLLKDDQLSGATSNAARALYMTVVAKHGDKAVGVQVLLPTQETAVGLDAAPHTSVRAAASITGDSELCQSSQPLVRDYWPDEVKREVISELERACHYESGFRN